MSDIKKLIESLESDISWLGYNSTEREIVDHIKQAITLLKEQEPVKPIERNGFWYCGNCRYALMTNHQKFCSDCGQEVKWE